MVQKKMRENVSQALRYYVPEHVADKFSDKVEPRESGESVYGTCLATDAENYTVLSERLEPEDLRALMNEYYEEITKPVTGHDGIITDIVADALMCVWVSPQTDCEKRLSACRAALGIRRSVERFNGRHRQHQLPTRIGLHAGWLSVGNIGGSGHYAYSLVGDIANTTSRIESLNRHLGTWILASEDVVSDVEGLMLRRLGMFLLKGKSEPVSIFEIMGEGLESDTGHSELLGRFASALQAYEEGLWQRAGRRFGEILVAYPDDGPSRFYVARCSQLAKIAPDIDARIIRMDQK
jgi:adenylate cyclase